MRTAMIRRSDTVALTVGERPFYGIGMPEPTFVQQRTGDRPEAVRRHFLIREAQAPKGYVERVFTNRFEKRLICRKQERPRIIQRLELLQQGDRCPASAPMAQIMG